MIGAETLLACYRDTLRRAATPGARQGGPKGLLRMLAAAKHDTPLVIRPAE